jgi:hypothetical protein
MKFVPYERYFRVYSPSKKEPKLKATNNSNILVLLKRVYIINNIVSISKIESGQMNLFKETSVKSQMESLYHDFKLKLRKNIKLKINITLSEIDNLILMKKKYPLYYHICFQMQ